MQYVTYPGGASLLWVVVVIGGIVGFFYLMVKIANWMNERWKP